MKKLRLDSAKFGRPGIIVGLGVMVCVLMLSAWFVELDFSRAKNGFFVLRGGQGKLLKLTSDLYLGEEASVVAGVSFQEAEEQGHEARPIPSLALKWDENAGTGYIRNYMADGTILVTQFSRYLDSQGKKNHGLFVGGALSSVLLNHDAAHVNDSGMAWYDGQAWNHIWCNTNEGIGSTLSPHRYAPSEWTYLGSKVREQSPQRVILESRHRVLVEGVLLQVERVVEAVAGQPYLDLEVKITNVSQSVANYYYYYGDEPWVGDFGGSAGDVGWVPKRLVEYEGVFDTQKFSYAGMVDIGSNALHEGHVFHGLANFIEWFGPNRPDVVFFANRYDGFAHDPQVKVPLQGDARSIGMYWGPRRLQPGESHVLALAIGKAKTDKRVEFPEIPCVEPPHQLVFRSGEGCGHG